MSANTRLCLLRKLITEVLLVMGYSEIKRGKKKKRKPEQGTPMIKWWRLLKRILKYNLERMFGRKYVSVQEWSWNDKVQEVTRAVKEAHMMRGTSGRQEERESYRQANKAAKKQWQQPSQLETP